MPLERPVMDNVLAIGDAAAFAEVENQGALMCGYHAANAVVKELEGNNGIEDYIKWWQQSFEFFNPEYTASFRDMPLTHTTTMRKLTIFRPGGK